MLTDDELRELLTKVREIHAAMLARRAANGSAPPFAPTSTAPAPKHDPRDPIVKISPRNWKGENCKGKRFSECPPLFLGMLSHVLDAFADAAEDDTDPQKQRYAKWDRENADAARKWRAKLEAKSAGSSMTQQELDEAF